MSEPSKVIWRPPPNPESRAKAIRLRQFTQGAFFLTIAATMATAAWFPFVTIAVSVIGGATTYYCGRSFWRLWLESEQEIQRYCHRVRREGALPTWLEVMEEMVILRETPESSIEIQCDSRFVPACEIPAGTWDCSNAVLSGYEGETVEFEEGTELYKRPEGEEDDEEEKIT